MDSDRRAARWFPVPEPEYFHGAHGGHQVGNLEIRVGISDFHGDAGYTGSESGSGSHRQATHRCVERQPDSRARAASPRPPSTSTFQATCFCLTPRFPASPWKSGSGSYSAS